MLSPFRMMQEFDDMMRDFGMTNLPRASMMKPGDMSLAIDIVEKPDKFLIKAEATNGVLSITLPKIELEQEENKTISITVSEGSSE